MEDSNDEDISRPDAVKDGVVLVVETADAVGDFWAIAAHQRE